MMTLTARQLSFAFAKYLAASATVLSLVTSSWASTILIDDFTTPQSVLATADVPSAFTATAATEAVGGERDMEAHLTGGFTSLSLSSNPFGGELLVHDSGTTVTGTTKIVWDGVDGVPDINSTGLGGLDFLTGLNAIRLDFLVADLTGDISLTLFDASDASGATSSRATFDLPGGIFSPTPVLIPYADFTAHGANGAANFSNVGAILLEITNETTGSLDVIIGSISAVPEPSSVMLALISSLAVLSRVRRLEC